MPPEKKIAILLSLLPHAGLLRKWLLAMQLLPPICQCEFEIFTWCVVCYAAVMGLGFQRK